MKNWERLTQNTSTRQLKWLWKKNNRGEIPQEKLDLMYQKEAFGPLHGSIYLWSYLTTLVPGVRTISKGTCKWNKMKHLTVVGPIQDVCISKYDVSKTGKNSTLFISWWIYVFDFYRLKQCNSSCKGQLQVIGETGEKYWKFLVYSPVPPYICLGT